MSTNVVETAKKIVISLDLGYGNLKAVCGEKRFCFRTIIGKQTIDETTSYLKGDSTKPVWERIDNMAVEVIEYKDLEDGEQEEVGRQFVYLGNKALRDAKESSVTLFDSKSRYTIKEMQYIIRAAIDLFLEPNNDYEVLLALGLPISQYAKERQEVVETVKKTIPNYGLKWYGDGHSKNQVAYEKDTARPPKFVISEVFVFPQAIFSTQAILFNSDSKPRLQFEEGDLVGIVDVGFGTVDGCLVRIKSSKGDYEIVQNKYIQSFKGVKEIYTQSRKLIKDELDMDASDEIVQKLIDNNGKVRIRMKDHDLTQKFEEIKKNLAGLVADEVKKQFEKEAVNIGILYLIGGGAVLLEKDLKAELSTWNAELFNPDNQVDGNSATYANALGFYRTLKTYALAKKMQIHE
ncbi:hypothetical protein ABD87_14785 [Lysinibacillus sphaericus]|uniref:ParM/StbA family protein n=1 Tax=Lysinibacillus sphaericus TaxID=1421 RepID=UPI0018CD2B06|nr:ParM/StbA family protein [Lysinibacillus sphaericus]MBG9730764.1 hypothetical protein [Lysinibacillus sphaericus]